MLYDVFRQFFPNNLVYGPQNFRYRPKMGLRKVAGGYENLPKPTVFNQKLPEYSLKGSQEYTLDDP